MKKDITYFLMVRYKDACRKKGDEVMYLFESISDKSLQYDNTTKRKLLINCIFVEKAEILLPHYIHIQEK